MKFEHLTFEDGKKANSSWWRMSHFLMGPRTAINGTWRMITLLPSFFFTLIWVEGVWILDSLCQKEFLVSLLRMWVSACVNDILCPWRRHFGVVNTQSSPIYAFTESPRSMLTFPHCSLIVTRQCQCGPFDPISVMQSAWQTPLPSECP